MDGRGRRGFLAGATDGDTISNPELMRIFVDIAPSRCDEVCAASGDPHYAFPTYFVELLRITAGDAAAVGT